MTQAIAFLIVAALLGELLLGRVADVLNLRSLPAEPPEELRPFADAERYRRVREYARARARFRLVPSTVQLVALLAFWWAGGFPLADSWARAAGFGPVGTGLLFVGILGLAQTALALPFAWWSTFVIEERFGFNRTTPRTFWADVARGLILAAVLGGALLAVVIALFERAGAAAWLACWLVATVFALALQVLAPVLILPLFNRFESLPDGELRDRAVRLAESVGFPVADVQLVDGSRRSTKANAFFTGVGRAKRIALFDTLVERHPTDEVLAVLAHELGHERLGHVIKGFTAGVAKTGVALAFLGLLINWAPLHAAFGMAAPSTHGGLVFFALLFSPVELVLGVLGGVLSRRHEYQADRFAEERCGLGAPLASALARLASDSLANPRPHRLHVVLRESHPPLLERIRRLRAAV